MIVLPLIVVVVLIVGIFINDNNIIDNIIKYKQLQNEIDEMEKRIEAKRENIDELEYRYEAPMDDEYIESVAKSELDLVNPDDIIVYKDVFGNE